jgi:hypothetical protein
MLMKNILEENHFSLWLICYYQISDSDLGFFFFGVKVLFFGSGSGFFQEYTNQSQSILHFAAKKENLVLISTTLYFTLV